VAHPDLDDLLDLLLGAARRLLEQHGEFLPFAAAAGLTGEPFLIAGDPGDEPVAAEMLELLVAGLVSHARAGDIRACGVCIDTNFSRAPTGPREEGICVRLAHRTGEAVDVILPYVRDDADRPTYGELFAAEGQLDVFERAAGPGPN